MKHQNELFELDNLEIEPLTDEDLESVVGGLCSLFSCSNRPKAETQVAN